MTTSVAIGNGLDVRSLSDFALVSEVMRDTSNAAAAAAELRLSLAHRLR